MTGIRRDAWRRRAHRARLLVVFALVAGAPLAGCGDSGSTATSPSPGVTVSGLFTGPATDSSGPGTLTWTVSQSGGDVTGSVSFSDTATGATGNGSVSGRVSGTTLTFTMSVPAGGFPSPRSGCTATMTGTAQATSTTIDGTYAGSNSCTGPIRDGSFRLTKP